MRPLPHGYTNDTRADGRVVVKRYDGPNAQQRRERERLMLTRLHGRVPVPEPRDSANAAGLAMAFMPGVHGQDLIDAGHAGPVLRACGRALRDIHRLDVAATLPGEVGPVVVHGDYGPNNVLLDPGTFTVTAVLDWEWAHAGQPLEDLAWCEWIVRMHHPAQASALDAFFAAYGSRPPWPERHHAMVQRCRELVELVQGWRRDAAQMWRDRLQQTSEWVECG